MFKKISFAILFCIRHPEFSQGLSIKGLFSYCEVAACAGMTIAKKSKMNSGRAYLFEHPLSFEEQI
jgi:hypothetical protein